jgi:hypothetical protein
MRRGVGHSLRVGLLRSSPRCLGIGYIYRRFALICVRVWPNEANFISNFSADALK